MDDGLWTFSVVLAIASREQIGYIILFSLLTLGLIGLDILFVRFLIINKKKIKLLKGSS